MAQHCLSLINATMCLSHCFSSWDVQQVPGDIDKLKSDSVDLGQGLGDCISTKLMPMLLLYAGGFLLSFFPTLIAMRLLICCIWILRFFLVIADRVPRPWELRDRSEASILWIWANLSSNPAFSNISVWSHSVYSFLCVYFPGYKK
jgi:hypothetical protein